MRKIVSALIHLVFACFFVGGNAVANTFAGGIPYATPYTYNGVTYDRYIVISRTSYDICSNTLAFYFVSSEMTAAGYPTGTWYSLVRGAPGTKPGFITVPNGSHALIFEAANVNGVCSWSGAKMTPTTTGATYTLRPDKAEGIHDHNFDLYTKSRSPYLLPYTFTGSYSSWGTWTDGGLYEGGGGFSFPIAGSNSTPYLAAVTSVMDNDVLGSNTPYTKNGTVTTFNNELFTAEAGCNCINPAGSCNSTNYSSCGIPGYRKPGGGSWNFSGTGVGQINYTDGGSYVYYDGHPGYDYGFGGGTTILAPAGGTLCVATSITTQSNTTPWRNTAQCSLSEAPGTSSFGNPVNWANYHTFYILHGSMNLNGSINEYMTVFLHNNNLESGVLSRIYQDGYASVSRWQEVAIVGGWGLSGSATFPAHLHIEFYKKNGSGGWDRVDPYGNGTSNILWQP